LVTVGGMTFFAGEQADVRNTFTFIGLCI